jgi:hypothetical protein
MTLSTHQDTEVELTDVFDAIGLTKAATQDSSPPVNQDTDEPSHSLGHALLRPCGYFAASRVAVLVGAVVAKMLVPRLNLVQAITGWDGHWYTLIARHGYPHGLFNEGDGSRWAFFPAYPAVVRLTVDITRLSYSQAEIVLSFFFGLTSVIAIWLAVRSVFGKVIADRVALLYVFFPASYVLSMAYTEGLFLTAAAACLYAISKKYWLAASMFAVVGSLSRSFGVVLIACVVVAALPVVLKKWEWRPMAAIVTAPLGFIAWLLYSWRETGTPLAFLKAEQFWGYSHFMWFMTPVISLARLLTYVHAWSNGQLVTAGVALIFAVVGIDLLWRAGQTGIKIPAYWWVFTIGSVLGMMSPYAPTSILRYSMAAFPLLAALAWKIRPHWQYFLVGLMGVTQAMLFGAVLVGTLHPHTTMYWP